MRSTRSRIVPSARFALGPLVATGLLTAAAGVPTAAAPPPTLPLEAVRPGMVGTMSTVLRGTQRETIEIELLGVLDDGIGPGVDMILCRLRGELGTWTGVAAGMSGSPVTVDGKLVGALSYSIGGFSKEPLCGITPIETMLALERYPAGLAPWTAGASARASGLEPVPLALAARGLDPALFDGSDELLRSLGLVRPVQVVPSAAPPASSEAGPPPALEPGDAVAGLLVWGDVQLAATGTVTWRDGERILAFGHPFMGTGRAEIPFAPATIAWTVPSLLSSFKISNVGRPAGTMTQDRLTAVAGAIGPVPDGLPVSLSIQRAGGAPVTRSFRVAKDPLVAPPLADLALRIALGQELGRERQEVLRARGTIVLADGRRLPFEATGPGVMAGDEQAIGGELGRKLTALMRPPMALPAVAGVELAVTSIDPEGVYKLTRALPDRLVARPGETLRVALDLDGPRGSQRRETLSLVVPESALPGRYLLLAGSPRTLAAELGGVAEARRRTARDAADYLASFETPLADDAVEIALALPAEGLVADGREYPALPGTAQLLLRSRTAAAGDAGRVRGMAVARASAPLERAVTAIARVPIEILHLEPTR